MPTTPQALDGETIDPSVSVPDGERCEARRQGRPPSPSSTRTGSVERVRVRGLPPSVDQPLVERLDRKFAHSDRLAFARMTAPGRAQPGDDERVRRPGGEQGGRPGRGRRARYLNVVLDQDRDSLKGPAQLPACQAASLAAACSRASGVTAITAPRTGFTSAMRSR